MQNKDREILRNLAARVAELAARPEEEKKRKLWYKHNSLEATRPVINCEPDDSGAWKEIISEDKIMCEGELEREWEFELRKEIFWGENIQDDRVIEAIFYTPYSYRNTGWGLETRLIGGESKGAYRWEAPLERYDDIEKLCYPQIDIDFDETRKVYELAQETFGDILHVELREKWNWTWTWGLTYYLIFIRGYENVLFDLYDYPDELHKLMVFLRDGHLKMLDFLEDNNLLSLNNRGIFVCSGGYGYSRELPQADFQSSKVRACDLWGFGESQETGCISTEMFAEFVFPYQKAILERFGLNGYGCCEPLNDRWEFIKSIPRLRRVSVSPWSNIVDMAEKLGDRYIFSMKPNPAYIAVPQLDEEYIRKDLRDAIRKTRNCRVEIIMKDIRTICNNPENVIRWTRIAKEEAGSI